MSRITVRSCLPLLLVLAATGSSCRNGGARDAGISARPAPSSPAGAPEPGALEPPVIPKAPAETPKPLNTAQSAEKTSLDTPVSIQPAVATKEATPAKASLHTPQKENVVLTLAQGQVVIDLFEEECPAHCDNFKRLARSGYLNGVTFHRVCPGFAQTGDPTATGKGGIEETIPAEIRRPHLRGSVVAARRADSRNPRRESHGSQFFIMKFAYPLFNGQYTVFAQVVKGMELIDRIPTGDKEDDYFVPQGAGEKIARAEVVPADH